MSRGAPGRGWRIDRIPGQPVRRLAGGACVLPLWLLRHGVHVTDLELRLSVAEAEALQVQLARSLRGGAVS